MELQKPVIFIEELIDNKKRYSLLAFHNDYIINSTEDLCNLCSEENENKEYTRYESDKTNATCKLYLENVREMNHERIKRMCVLIFQKYHIKKENNND